MVRKLNLITITFMLIVLMPLPVYAYGGGHRGFGGHGFGGHSSFGGHGGFTRGGFNFGHFGGRQSGFGSRGFPGQSGFNSGHFGGYSRYNGSGESGFSGRGGSWGHGFSGHNGFNNAGFNSGHFGGHSGFGGNGFNGHNGGNFNHRGFHHGHHEEFEEENFLFASSFFFGLGLGAILPFAVFPPLAFAAYPYYFPCCDYYPYYGYPYDAPPPDVQPNDDTGLQVTPDDNNDDYASDVTLGYAQSNGNLEIHVTPENIEIYVDGSYIGQANNFRGTAIVSVPSGTHVVEFRYNGLSSSTTIDVNSDAKSVIQERFGSGS